MDNNIIFPLSKVPNVPCHLLYADGMLLFLKGQKSSLLALKKILEEYQISSGQFINLGKSKMFNGKHSLKKQILAITDLQEKPLHSHYLGAPLIIGTPKKHHFNPLLDRFLSKLSDW